MSNEGHGPRSDHGDATRDGLLASSSRHAPSALELALRNFRELAATYATNDGALPDVRAAIARVADLGRNAGVQPEELIVSVKQIYISLPLEHTAIDEREALKQRFVTWLIEAYFSGRAD